MVIAQPSVFRKKFSPTSMKLAFVAVDTEQTGEVSKRVYEKIL